MAHSNLFVDESSDEDSIRTEYTTDDDPEKEYDIERVLDYDETLEKYLIKWTGYPIYEATWEPRDGLPEEDSEIWTDWRQFLKDVKQGKKEPFDRADWNRRWQAHRAEKNQRRARRNAKRRKKGMETRPDTLEEEEEQALLNEASDDEFEEEESEEEPLARRATTVRAAPQQVSPRKGVAQKLKRARSKQNNDGVSSEESSSSSSESSRDSLVDELRRSRRQPPLKKLRSPRKEKETIRERPQPAAPTSPKRQRPALDTTRRTVPIMNERREPPKQPPKQTAAQPAQDVVARKSVPTNADQGATTARAKKSRNVMANWDANKQKRRRVPAPSELSHGGAQPRFQHLRVQHAVQKYSSRSEAAPDINALDIIDPKTGKVIKASSPSTDRLVARTASMGEGRVPPAQSSIQPVAESRSIGSAYARRTPPPAARESSLPGATTGDNRPAVTGTIGTAGVATHVTKNPAVAAEDGRDRPHRVTCRFWSEGNCYYSADECFNLHFYPPGDATKISGEEAARLRLPPKNQPYRFHELFCHFWRAHGKCNHNAHCKYAHYDTGFDAPPPKVTVEDARASQEAYMARLAEIAQKNEPMSKDPEKVRVPPDMSYIPLSKLTCHFWRTQGACLKGDTCKFAHRDTGFDALAPGAMRKVSKSGTFSAPSADSPNLEPLAEHRKLAGIQNADPGTVVVREAVQASAPQVPALSTVSQISPDIVMSPTHLVGSPAHPTPNEAVRPSESWNSPWHTNGAAAAAVMLNASFKLYHAGDERPHRVRAKFEMIGDRSFIRMFGSDPIVRAGHAVLSGDVQAVLWDSIRQSNEIAAGFLHLDVAEEDEMAGLSEVCKLNDCGIVATVVGYSSTILIYPSDAEPWKFLDGPDMPLSSASLKFYAFDGLPSLQRKLQSTDAPAPIDMQPLHSILGRDLAHLDVENLFVKSPEAVFLMIPSTYSAISEVYRQIFTGMKCKVYHSDTAGAWDYFRRKYRTGVLLVHTDVPLWKVPGLAEWSSQATAVFTVGVDEAAAILEDRKATFGCTRILALGNAVFLTDDLLVYHPESATEIIQNFLDANSFKPEGAEANKILARPGLKQFLFKNFIDREKPDERWLRLYGAVCDLCPPEMEDREESPNPLPNANLVSIDPELLPSFKDLWKKDDIAAADFMVNWFAGWALLNTSRFRRFVVCYLPKAASSSEDPKEVAKDIETRGWTEKYQHISVLTPDKVVQKIIRPHKRKEHVRTWTK
ncbi:hypothetical protein CKM354_000047400 [Cercospora kikuchii]|uniref:Chromo domain-containing protein n=1 Tax=Cercospora kikuchii TaxID=84275 RepID=A0A9P3C910_9PEZI|nr:uncharacterized protein CKM354_000047400 [Cercospora kikuchii]GIZ37011.1 hypothetical protein CKM354_000047400 [Cercospora kikuchii]